MTHIASPQRQRRASRASRALHVSALLAFAAFLLVVCFDGRPAPIPIDVREVTLEVDGRTALRVDIEVGELHATLEPKVTPAAALASRLERAGWEVAGYPFDGGRTGVSSSER